MTTIYVIVHTKEMNWLKGMIYTTGLCIICIYCTRACILCSKYMHQRHTKMNIIWVGKVLFRNKVTISENRINELEVDEGGIYGKIWREERLYIQTKKDILLYLTQFFPQKVIHCFSTMINLKSKFLHCFLILITFCLHYLV